MIEIVFGELRFFKSAFSRSRTWLWFCLMVVAFMGNCDPIGGIAGLVRTLGLDISAYSGFLNFFQSTAIDRAALQASVFHWLRLRFKDKIVTIGGRELLILDAKKQAKSGKRMPGVKWHHQESSSASKKEYVTAHSFECLGLAINCVGCVSCLVFLIRMIDGVRKHNRDGRTLKENGLVAIEDLFHSTARLVGHPLAMRLDQGELREIVDAMRDASVGVGAPA